MRFWDSQAPTRKMGILVFLAVLAAVVWLAAVVFLYSRQPEVSILMRVLAMLPVGLAAGGVCFLFLWRPLATEDPEAVSHEDFGSALRVQKIASMYVALPVLNRSVRREIIPAAIAAALVFLLGITPLGPFKSIKITFPAPEMLVARDVLRPMLILAGDSLAVPLPPALSPQTEAWGKIIPALSPAMEMYRLILQGEYGQAIERGVLATDSGDQAASDSTFRQAYAQALLLNGDYEKAAKLFDEIGDSPVIAMQKALTHIHLGDLDAAEEILDKTTATIDHEDFPAPEMITEHLRQVIFILRGKSFRETGEKLGRTWEGCREAYVQALTPEEKNGKTTDPQTSTLDALRLTENQSNAAFSPKQRQNISRLKDDFLVVNNNHVVFLVLQGAYAGAYREADLGKYLATGGLTENSGRMAGLADISAWNSQGVLLSCMEKHLPVEGATTAAKAAGKAETLPNAQLAESVLKDAPLPTECFAKSVQIMQTLGFQEDSTLRMILHLNLLEYYVRSEFSLPAVPTVEAFLELAGDSLHVVRTKGQEQRKRVDEGYDRKTVPTWIVAAHLTLMDYSMKIEGQELNHAVMMEAATRDAERKLGKNSLAELAARTRFIELRLCDRFTTDAKLGSLRDTEKMLRETLETVNTSKTLPISHPVIASLKNSTVRMALLSRQPDAVKKVEPAMKAYENLQIPEAHSGKCLAAITDYLAKSALALRVEEEKAKLQAQQELQTEATAISRRVTTDFGKNSLLSAQWLRDTAYIQLLQKQTAAAAKEYEKASEIYLAIYGEKSKHISVTNLEKLLKEYQKPAAGRLSRTPAAR